MIFSIYFTNTKKALGRGWDREGSEENELVLINMQQVNSSGVHSKLQKKSYELIQIWD